MSKLPVLEDILGGEAAWGEEADQGLRWAPLLQSGQRDGAELWSGWEALQLERRRSATFAQEVVEGPLTVDVRGAGSDGAGTLRQRLTEGREKLRGKVLLRALELHPNRAARPVWSWKERDKLSTAWLLCLPGPTSPLSSAEFSEAFAALLCAPSPACHPRLGEPVAGRRIVDKFGDNVVNATMRGDGWRSRHDKMKLCLRSLLIWAGIPVTCEVFNLFADCIPQAGLARIERGRRRQGLVPDFKIQGEQGEGDVLCELKCMSASASRYPHNPRDGIRAVDRRADGLSADYARKAVKVDQEYGGTPVPGQRIPGAPAPPRVVGRVEARLLTFGRIHGWCFGAWGEASSEVHELVQRLATSTCRFRTAKSAF